MTKQKRWIGVTVLTGVTVVALVAGTIIKKNMNVAPGDVIAVTADGTSAGIKEIVVLSDEQGNVTGYKVNVETVGYNQQKPIVMEVTFNETADEVTELQIISQTETDGLGSKIAEDEFLKQFVNAKLPVYLEGMAPVSEEAETTPEATPELNDIVLKDGIYEATGEESRGYTSTVTVTVEDSKITNVTIEAVDAEGNKKSVLSENGGYVMTENGPTWAAQVNAVSEFIIANQSATGITMDEEGKTDVIASVSISVSEYISLFKEAISKAATSVLVLNDGTYEATGEESRGYTTTATVTVADGKITDVIIESVDADGNKKSVLSENGGYVMTETGPTWAAQVNAVADFIVANQSTVGITMDEEGKTDAIASVSIAVSEYVSLVEGAIAKAVGVEESEITPVEESKEALEEVVVEGTAVDAVTNATISSKGVIAGIESAREYLLKAVIQ